MKNKISYILIHKVLPIVFWISVWEIASIIINQSHFLPSVSETFNALIKVVSSREFPRVVGMSLLRIFEGITLGTLFGIILAILSYKFTFVHSLISPFNSVIKATPVASIIILLWISMNGHNLAVFVSLLMVFPIIWQNVYDAFSSIDNNLVEVSRVFQFSFKKKMTILVLPSLKKFFIPAFITSIGLAFKAEIAAEIIAGVKNSIGQMIYYAKDKPATDEMFAWTIIGIFFSILFESLARILLSPPKKNKSEVVI